MVVTVGSRAWGVTALCLMVSCTSLTPAPSEEGASDKPAATAINATDRSDAERKTLGVDMTDSPPQLEVVRQRVIALKTGLVGGDPDAMARVRATHPDMKFVPDDAFPWRPRSGSRIARSRGRAASTTGST